MESFRSLIYLGVFLPITLMVYYLAPRRMRPWTLLAASLICFMLISGVLVWFMVYAALVAYAGGRVIEAVGTGALDARPSTPHGDSLPAMAHGALPASTKAERARIRTLQRRVLIAAIALLLGALVATKYLAFFLGVGASAIGHAAGVNLPAGLRRVMNIGLPIGISFYTLSAIGYLVDVYRQTVKVEHNPARLLLFLCFFPQLMEGPICRYQQMREQLWAGEKPSTMQVAQSIARIAEGLAKMMIVSDRLNLFVAEVFKQGAQAPGSIVAAAAILYTVQLYCDFSGTIDIVRGSALLVCVEMPRNFRQPFFSKTAGEFWERWHITLGAWLRDYVFYPVSLSRFVKRFAKRMRHRFGPRVGSITTSVFALGAVWLLNGLWHGAGWNYLLFGVYYLLILLGASICEPLFQHTADRLRIDRSARVLVPFRILRTWCIVFIGELFFRAETLGKGIAMFANMVAAFRLDGSFPHAMLSYGMDGWDYLVVGIACLVMLAVGMMRERRERQEASALRDCAGQTNDEHACETSTENECVRPDPEMSCAAPSSSSSDSRSISASNSHRDIQRLVAVTALLLATTLIFGAYGFGYTPLDPIYAQF